MVHLGPKKPPVRKGSMFDVPETLIDQINKLEALFVISPEKLKAITNHFVSELTKGLSKEGGSIPMIPGWVMDYPTGKETGDFLAIDLGGTNLRICLIKLNGDKTFGTSQSKFALPSDFRTTTKEKLFNFIAESLRDFVHEEYPDGVPEGTKLPLGFTFSYPCTQYALNQGILQRWTKGFDIKGVEGQDVVPMLQEVIAKLNLPIDVLAVINDTSGTLVASAYTDSQTQMGLIFGTGCNGAYFEKVGAIPKLEGTLYDDISKDDIMVINCEYGAFDNEHFILPRTKYDIVIDEDSPRPHQQSFEKMISGYYLGEILRLILLEVHDEGLIFRDQDISELQKSFVMDTSFPSRIEDDPFENLSDTKDLFQLHLGLKTTVVERKFIRKIAELIGTRSARLSVCGVAAIAKKRQIKSCHCAADGSVFNKYPRFQERAAQALSDIFDWNNLPKSEHPIKLVAAEDGSGAGAAIIAALAQQRLKTGKSLGMKNH